MPEEKQPNYAWTMIFIARSTTLLERVGGDGTPLFTFSEWRPFDFKHSMGFTARTRIWPLTYDPLVVFQPALVADLKTGVYGRHSWKPEY